MIPSPDRVSHASHIPRGLCERCWCLVEGVKDVDVDGVAIEHREALENVDLLAVSIRST